MFGDLVRVELIVWPITSFDPRFGNFQFGKRLWEGKNDNIRIRIWVSGIILALLTATGFSRCSNWSRESETKSIVCKQH